MKIIILLGMPLSGKTTHAKAVLDDVNVPLVETGTFVYQEVRDRGLKATPENVKLVAGECKAKSDSYFTEKAMDYIKENEKDTPAIFMSGVKAFSEIEYLNSSVGPENVILISFHASVDTRHGRLTNEDRRTESNARGEKGKEDEAMAEDKTRFNLRDRKELGYGLGKLMALADYVINTENVLWPYSNFETTLSDFKKILSKIVNN